VGDLEGKVIAAGPKPSSKPAHVTPFDSGQIRFFQTPR
jgi:hypothetical protein